MEEWARWGETSAGAACVPRMVMMAQHGTAGAPRYLSYDGTGVRSKPTSPLSPNTSTFFLKLMPS